MEKEERSFTFPPARAAEPHFHLATLDALFEEIIKHSKDKELKLKVDFLTKKRKDLVGEEKLFIENIKKDWDTCGHHFSILHKSSLGVRNRNYLLENYSFRVNLPGEEQKLTFSRTCDKCFATEYRNIMEIMFPVCRECWGEMKLTRMIHKGNAFVRYPAGDYKCQYCGRTERLWENHD